MERMNKSVRRVVLLGIMLAMALGLSYAESFIPVIAGIPGIKPGLANAVLLFALYSTDLRSSFGLMLSRVTLSAILFAGFTGFLYSLAGGVLSFCVMTLLKKTRKFSVIGVSVAGAASHNIGQIAVAAVLINSRAVIAYLPVLMVTAIICGMLTGTVAKLVLRALPQIFADNRRSK